VDVRISLVSPRSRITPADTIPLLPKILLNTESKALRECTEKPP
jgi:hypothetical protein